jgi:phosphoribosyl 1,2-cyclic phosphodiesterase
MSGRPIDTTKARDVRGSRIARQRCYHGPGALGQNTGEMAEGDFTVRFWGVRGSIPVSSPQTSAGGGNTSCVEVRCGGRILLLDAGSGIREAGLALRREKAKDVDIFLTHAHWDHIIGLPFYKPLFCSGMATTVWSGHLAGIMTTRELIEDLMRAPFLPVGPEVFCGEVDYRDFEAGQELQLGASVTVKTRTLNHPGGAIGYRVEQRGRAIAYVTDTEHEPGILDPNVLDLIGDAELMIYDCTYTEEEFAEYRGYGHSTWEQGVRLCRAANAKRLAIFHHYPNRSDKELDGMEATARADFPGAFAARDGMVIQI